MVDGDDRLAGELLALASLLLATVRDVHPAFPQPELLKRLSVGVLEAEIVQRGLDAVGWVRDERGLGGGREFDGLAWMLRLDRLWESYVESVVRVQARRTGGLVRVGRTSDTLFPLHWSDPTHRSLGHLVPDIVVQRGRSVWIVDAKYKAHLADLDESGWHQMAQEVRDSHRADLHQVLAYAALFDAEEITATLAYPLRPSTWAGLVARGLDRSTATLFRGARQLRIELWGLPFGGGTAVVR